MVRQPRGRATRHAPLACASPAEASKAVGELTADPWQRVFRPWRRLSRRSRLLAMKQGRGRRAGDAGAVPKGAAPAGVHAPRPGALVGHEVAPLGDGVWIEAWAPELAACLVEALNGLVEATDGDLSDEDAPSYEAVPLSAGPARPHELLTGLFEEVLGAQQVLSLAPVRFHLATTEDGGVAGDMELAQRRPVRRHAVRAGAVAREGLVIAEGPTGWRCRVRLVV